MKKIQPWRSLILNRAIGYGEETSPSLALNLSKRRRKSAPPALRFPQRKDGASRGVYGYDGGKKVKGRKRHIVVDSQGFLLGVLVTEANASERLGAVVILHEAKEKFSRLEVVWVDAGYSGENFVRAVQQVCGESVRVEVIQRNSPEFEILPKRWIVERTFGWLNRFRRLSKDYELYAASSEAMIYGSLIRLMIRRFVS